MDILLRSADNQKQVDYRKFVHALNWRENQAWTFTEVQEPPKVKPIKIGVSV